MSEENKNENVFMPNREDVGLKNVENADNKSWNEISYENATNLPMPHRAVVQSRTAPDDLTGEITDGNIEELKEHLTLPTTFDGKSIWDDPRDETEQPKVDDLESARQAGMTWTHNEKEYELFIVNRTGGIALPYMQNDVQVGIIGARFAWTDKSTMLAVMQSEIVRETDTRDNTTRPKPNDSITANAKLFREIVQDGYFIDTDEPDSEPEKYDRKAMLDLEPEVQSSLIYTWLDRFYVKRYFPKGSSKTAGLFASKEQSVFFECRISDVHNPRHLLLVEFNKPSRDARRDYAQKKQDPEQKQDGDIVRHTTYIDYNFRQQQFGKYLKAINGYAIAKRGELELDDSTITFKNEKEVSEALKLFVSDFNPVWNVKLVDELFDAFDNTGK